MNDLSFFSQIYYGKLWWTTQKLSVFLDDETDDFQTFRVPHFSTFPEFDDLHESHGFNPCFTLKPKGFKFPP